MQGEGKGTLLTPKNQHSATAEKTVEATWAGYSSSRISKWGGGVFTRAVKIRHVPRKLMSVENTVL